MKQFQANFPKIEVSGRSILSTFEAMEHGKEFREEVLDRHFLTKIKPEGWYPIQTWLNVFNEFYEQLGEHTIYLIGRAIPRTAKFPPQIQTLKDALSSLDIAYHDNHRGGEIGHYNLISFDPDNRRAVMECLTPYPCSLEKGILMELLINFKPRDSFKYDVSLDSNKQNKKDGGESSTYVVTW